MKVGDLVKYTWEDKDLQDLTGLVVETSNDRFRHAQARVLWSDAQDAVWDLNSQLSTISKKNS